MLHVSASGSHHQAKYNKRILNYWIACYIISALECFVGLKWLNALKKFAAFVGKTFITYKWIGLVHEILAFRFTVIADQWTTVNRNMKLGRKVNHKYAYKFCHKYFYDKNRHRGSKIFRLCLTTFRQGLRDIMHGKNRKVYNNFLLLYYINHQISLTYHIWWFT
jgi:hypothetical protein